MRTWLIIAAVLALIVASMVFFSGPLPNISLAAETVFSVGSVNITNAMLASWVVTIVLVVLALVATRRNEMVPRGLQNFFEAVIELMLGIMEGVTGPERARKFFPLVATIFLFIVTSNWLGLIPGFGTIGLVRSEEEAAPAAETGTPGVDVVAPTLVQVSVYNLGPFSFAVQWPNFFQPKAGSEGTEKVEFVSFFRSANSSLSTTVALALISVAMIEFWGFQALGLGYATKFVNFRGGPLGILIGVLELISELGRIISFSFRLFGNIFAGEVLLAVIGFLIPWMITVVFLGLEVFVGFIQGLVFAALTLVFAHQATLGHGGHEAAHEEHHTEPHLATEHAA